MREILFRGKLKDTGEWVYWDVFGRITTHTGKQYILTVTSGAHTAYYYHAYQIMEKIDRTSIGQSTSLKDKNRKRIFEGDIFQYGFDEVAAVAVVKFGGFGFGSRFDMNQVGFYAEWNHRAMYYRTDLGFWVKQREIEIIGNIHDNPEFVERYVENAPDVR